MCQVPILVSKKHLHYYVDIEGNYPYQLLYTNYRTKNTSTQVRCHETLSRSQKQNKKNKNEL